MKRLPSGGDQSSMPERPGFVVRTEPLRRPPAAWADVRAALIRPDGHVTWTGAGENDARVMTAVRQALPASTRPPWSDGHHISGRELPLPWRILSVSSTIPHDRKYRWPLLAPAH
ncbi:hypothetical protein [Streptomyces sp. NPDC056387]|uniref:hypothetical protein n=1 Tax=Streptomyces sp. NPDC056387 TaxID=3345803 RepID=UPI0035D59A57